MFTYISLGLLAVTAFFVLINVLKGLIRGIKKTVGTLVAIILSAVISAIVTAIICNPTSELLATAVQSIKDALGEGEIQDIFAIEAINEAVTHYIAMIAAPFVFLALYIVLSLIVGIIVRIVLKFIPPFEKPRAVIHRLGGVGVGLVCGLLVSILLLMPFVGIIDILVGVSQSELLAADDMREVREIFDGAEDDAIFTAYSDASGWIFDSFASSDYHGQRVYLKNDIEVIISVLGNISALAGEADDLADDQITALNAVVDNLDRSPLLKGMLAGVIAEMATKWTAGEAFMGMEKIDAGELLDPVMNTIFTVLSTSDETNVVADLRTLTDILGVFVKHDMLSDSENYDGMLDKLAGDGVIAELITVSNHNERMSVLSDEITKLSIRALASAIGIPQTHDERYENLMSDIATMLNDSYYMSDADRLAYVEERVNDALDEYGVEVEGQASRDIAASIVADLGDTRNLEGSDVREFFVIYAIANGNADSSASISGYEVLSDKENKLVCNPDGTISVGDLILENYTVSNYGDSMAYTMGKTHVDIGDAATLYSADAMKSSLITFEDILANVKRYTDCADPDGEAQKISDILAAATGLFSSEDDGKMDKTKVLSEMGEVLELMSKTEIFGDKVTADLLTAIFQSKDIRGELGLSMSEANDFTRKMSETAKGENSSYITTTQAVSGTVDVIEKLNDSSTSKEERNDATKKILADMSPENADLMGSLTTPSMMMNYGASESKADIVSSSVSALFNNMATFQPDTESSEGQAQYDSEAQAVNSLLQLAMDGADSKATSLFDHGDGEAKTGNTAGEFVDLMVNSEVVGATLVTTVYEEGNTENPYGVVPTEQDKVALNEELNSYYNENKNNGDEQLEMKLNAVAIISGMEPIFDINK